MSNGVKGAGANPGPAPISGPDIQETKKADSGNPGVTTEKKEPQKPSGPSGRSAEGLTHDTGVAMRKAALSKSLGLTKPTRAQVEEIRNAMKEGKKDEAIKLTIKYYNIDTSGAQEIKYVGGAKAEGAAGANSPYKENKTGTHKIDGKITIGIGDESFEFKGKESPEWLAAAIYHESFHAKNHFKPDKPVFMTEPPNTGGVQQPKMSQQEIAEEIQAYVTEQKASDKLGLNEEMLSEINDRRNKLYRELTSENRATLSPILRGTQPWPQ